MLTASGYPLRVYTLEGGICLRNHCGAELLGDIEPPGLVTTVGGRDRASASYAAADRVKALASAGDTQKPFGRVFYAKDKSLVFYGYDHDQQPGIKSASLQGTFTVQNFGL
jgi:hypothetical protein